MLWSKELAMEQEMANVDEEKAVDGLDDMAPRLDWYHGHHRRVLDDGQWFYPFGSPAVIEATRRATDLGVLATVAMQ